MGNGQWNPASIPEQTGFRARTPASGHRFRTGFRLPDDALGTGTYTGRHKKFASTRRDARDRQASRYRHTVARNCATLYFARTQFAASTARRALRGKYKHTSAEQMLRAQRHGKSRVFLERVVSVAKDYYDRVEFDA
jgi:hypothetical protein